jgi:hypothetical protein
MRGANGGRFPQILASSALHGRLTGASCGATAQAVAGIVEGPLLPPVFVFQVAHQALTPTRQFNPG